MIHGRRVTAVSDVPAAQELVTHGVTLEMQTKLLLVGGVLLPANDHPDMTWSVIDVSRWADSLQPYHPIWEKRLVIENEFDDPLSAYNAFWRDYHLHQQEKSS